MNTELDDLIGVDYGEEYYPSRQMTVIKKDGTADPFNVQKVLNAVSKSAFRASVTFTEGDRRKICENIISRVDALPGTEISIAMMHNIVEQTLDLINPAVAKSYRDYRNYKQDFVKMLDEVYKKSQSIMYIGDKENSNTDSALVSTKRSLVFNQLNKELYKKFFLTTEELQACNDGYIYIHDMSARRDTMNCFRRDTRFITKDGVKSFYDFSDGDTTYVLSHKGVWQKAVVHKYGNQKIQKVTFKMGTYTSKEWVVYCTPNHRWILKDGTETTELKVGDILWQVPDITTFEWEDLTLEQKKLWCRGFILGDGAIIGSRNKTQGAPNYAVLRLCGEKIKYADRFRDCGYNVTHVTKNDNDLLVHMLDCTDKEIPWLSLDYNNIIYYINGLMCADGHKKLSKSAASEFRGIQVTGDLNKYIYNLLNMAGYFVGTTKDITNQVTNYGPRSKETIIYNVHSSQNRTSAWRVKSIESATLNPKAEVWCLEVENDHSFLLEGGIPTGNCCLFDVGNVLKGGFEMGNVWYNEPKTLDTAFDVIGDIVLSGASQQYGGFTVPEVDKILAPYAEKSYRKYYNEYLSILQENGITENAKTGADAYAMKKVKRDFMQGVQGWEYKFNTVSSSRGDYPFITMTFGIGTSRFEKMASIAMLDVRREGQGKKDRKKPVLFPKLVFLYDENLHGPGKPLEDVFEAGIKCSAKTMYPDWLSLTGNGYVPSMYKQYGRVVSPMGCRAFLSPWYERGGTHPADKDDKPIFVGRYNIGVVSLHLPMILAKARQENKDFYDVLDYYLELIRKLHIRTYAYLGEMRASTNPLAYCEGGFLGGYLKPSDKIKPLLKPMTASFGITALNELQELYNGKSLVEDGTFAVEVMEYINAKINQFKEEDDILYALYGTPAENLCGLQIKQFREKYGVIPNVSDRPYVSNSFHCHVTEDITPIEKQDLEHRFWNTMNGGKIQYVKYPVNYNIESIKTLVHRAMQMGYYEGVNLSLAYCDDCGHQELEMDVCPVCGSRNLTKIERMNGYLSYSRVHGDTRLNDAKMAEIADRKSM